MTQAILTHQSVSATSHPVPQSGDQDTLISMTSHVMPNGALASLDVQQFTGIRTPTYLGHVAGPPRPYVDYSYYLSTFQPDGELLETAFLGADSGTSPGRVDVTFSVATNHGVYVRTEVNGLYRHTAGAREIAADGTAEPYYSLPGPREGLILHTPPTSLSSLRSQTREDPHIGEYQELRLPGGQSVISFIRATENGETLFVQYRDAEGQATTLPFAVAERDTFLDHSLAANRGGNLWLQFRTDGNSEEPETFSHGIAAFEQLTAQTLSAQQDVTYLAEAGAIDGGGANDTLSGSLGDDRILGGSGDDLIGGSTGNDAIDGGQGNDTIYGGDGDADTAFFSGAVADYAITEITGGYIVEHIGGTAEDGRDTLISIEQLIFADIAIAPEDLNSLRTQPSQATDGDDWIWATQANDTLDGLLGNDSLSGLSGNDKLLGGDGNDSLFGQQGHDTLIGGDGDDLLDLGEDATSTMNYAYAGAGQDLILGSRGTDDMRGDAGSDRIHAGAGADLLIGGAGDDFLYGDGGIDALFGGMGNDLLAGGLNHDRLNGGAGADQFFHVGRAAHATDWIQDYTAADGDVLVYGATTASHDQFQVNFTETANAGTAGVEEAFVIYRPTGQILWALVDGQAQDEINLQIGGEVVDLLG